LTILPDIGHGFYWPETGNLARKSNPGPIKRSCCMVWASNPGPTKYNDLRIAAYEKCDQVNCKESVTIQTTTWNTIIMSMWNTIITSTWNMPIGLRMMARPLELLILEKRSKIKFSYQDCVESYKNHLISFVKTYQECVESYTTHFMSLMTTYQECLEFYTMHLMSLVKTYQECVELYTLSLFTADKPASFLIVF
jgi:hypothetical protein